MTPANPFVALVRDADRQARESFLRHLLPHWLTRTALQLHDFRRLRVRRLYGWRSFRVRRGAA